MKILILLGLSLLLFARGYDAPDNRSQAKNILKMIDLDYKETRLNGCKYTYDTTSCMDKTIVDPATCEVNEKNVTMMWMQVVPDTFYGRNFACMREKVCTNVFTKEKFGSPMCCRRIDPLYQQMEADLYNLIPVVSSIAQKRGNRIFGRVDKADEVIGEVKFDQNYIEPPLRYKGDVARVYLYMNDRYGLAFSAEQRENFMAWHKIDPVDERECHMAKVIDKIQGYQNSWIKEGCR